MGDGKKTLVLAMAAIIVMTLTTFGVNAASNKTVVMGVVYDQYFTNELSAVPISVNCNNNIVRATSIESAGNSYFNAFFDEDQCPLGASVNVTASGERIGFNSGIVHTCDENSYCSDYNNIIIKNLAIINLDSTQYIIRGHWPYKNLSLNYTNITNSENISYNYSKLNFSNLDYPPKLSKNTRNAGIQLVNNKINNPENNPTGSFLNVGILRSGIFGWIIVIVIALAAVSWLIARLIRKKDIDYYMNYI